MSNQLSFSESCYQINQIDRGYERIDERLNGLGAQIRRVDLT